jgi:hypothetical protein
MQANPPAPALRRASQYFLAAAIFAFLLPLALYMTTGTAARFIQDDYCYAVHVRANGWPDAAFQAYVHEVPFSGNRVALTFFTGLAEILGPANVPVLPGLMILLWLPAAVLLFRHLNRAFAWGLSNLETLLAGIALVSLTLYLAPNRVQVLYWRIGMFTYLAPMVLFFWLLTWGASRLGKRTGFISLAGMAALALVTGSFSETAAVFVGGVNGVVLLAAFIGMRRKTTLAWSAFRPAWAGLFGSLIAMASLILSPAGRLRQAAQFPEPPPPLEILQISLESARFFAVHTLYRVTLPTLAIAGLALCLGFFAYTQRKSTATVSIPHFFTRLLLGAGIAFFLLVCVTSPTAYAEATYPEARVLVFARLVMVAFSAWAGWWSGHALAGWLMKAEKTHLFALLAVPAAGLFAFGLLGVRPGTYLEPVYPELRAYLFANPLTSLVVVVLALSAGALVAWLSRRQKSYYWPALLMAGVFLLQPLFAARTALYELPDYQLRGQMWDFRDAQIHELKALGQRDITVQALDSWAAITELQANPDHWVNHCAADYYGVDRITAVEPILNPPVNVLK